MPGEIGSNSDVEEGEGLQVFRSHISKRKKRYTVCIEGNIGCGKSTFLKYFENDHTVETLKEPVQQWTDVQGHNALQLLYEDPARWNFSFNNYAMLTRMEMHKKRPDALVKLLERSLYSTRYVFVENSHRSGLLTSLEYTVLDEWFQYLLQSQEVNVDLIVYLRASPQICYERLRKRDRKEEAGVPIEFIQELHDLHEEWLIEKNKYPLPAPVLVLDASHDLPEMFKVYDEHRAEILCGASP